MVVPTGNVATPCATARPVAGSEMTNAGLERCFLRELPSCTEQHRLVGAGDQAVEAGWPLEAGW